jgi:hypothetical protein
MAFLGKILPHPPSCGQRCHVNNLGSDFFLKRKRKGQKKQICDGNQVFYVFLRKKKCHVMNLGEREREREREYRIDGRGCRV